MRLRTLIGLTLLALAASACDEPTSGDIDVDLVTPNNGDGAILFKLSTASSKELVEVAAACPGCQAFSYRVSDYEVYCVVTGTLTSGPLARVTVSDAAVGSVFEAEILEVATLDRRLRSTIGYELSLSR